jgi:hypothetical protein
LLPSITYCSRFNFGFCAEKIERGDRAVFGVLREFLKGVLGKVGGWTWFCGGENVVECVVNVVL